VEHLNSIVRQTISSENLNVCFRERERERENVCVIGEENGERVREFCV
jgi:hypothetical protein